MILVPQRRSCLTVPGASEKMLAKALSLAADELVLDLEDAVAPADKADARSRVVALLAAGAWHDRAVSVRINAIGSAWWRDDVTAVATAGHPRLAIVVPKVDHPGDLAVVEQALGKDHVALQALIETAAGVVNAREIAAATPRLQALVIGYADLASSMGRPTGSTASWQSVQDLVLLAARARQLQAIDGPFFQIDAAAALRADCERGRAQGFDGKWAIHPAQVETINAVFTPSDSEVADARSIIAHLNQTGGAASSFAGGMVDEAMRHAAVRTLSRAGLAE